METSTARRPPLVPEDIRRPRPADCLVRAILASARTELEVGQDPTRIVRALWPSDDATPMVLRAATSPASTSAAGWAAELAQTAVADFVTSLGPQSAGGELLRRATMLTFGSNASIFVPNLTATASNIPFVQQGQPVPIRELLLDGPTLEPKKFGVGIALSREVAEASTPNAERLVRTALSESVGLALDNALFDAVAASDTRPAGLRAGISATAATAGGDTEAMIADLVALATAVAPRAGSQIAFVASPEDAVRIALRSPVGAFPYPVLASAGLPSGTVMAIAVNSLVGAVDSVPRFTVSREAVYHSENTTPLAIATAGTPNVVAAPVRSLFQTDCIAIKLVMDLAWGLRAAGSVAWVENVTW
jgi:hypothetical protein